MKSFNHPQEDVAKSSYNPNMKYKSLLKFLYFHYYTLKTKHSIWRFLLIFFSLLGIENLQNQVNCFNFEFWVLNFGESSLLNKRLILVLTNFDYWKISCRTELLFWTWVLQVLLFGEIRFLPYISEGLGLRVISLLKSIIQLYDVHVQGRDASAFIC